MLTVKDAGLQALHVVGGHPLRVGQGHCDLHGHCHLIHPQVGVGGDDCAASEVDALAAQVPPKPALLSLQPLDEAPAGHSFETSFMETCSCISQ